MNTNFGEICYAAAVAAGGAMVLYGQAFIIIAGLILGLTGATLYRRSTKNRRYKA